MKKATLPPRIQFLKQQPPILLLLTAVLVLFFTISSYAFFKTPQIHPAATTLIQPPGYASLNTYIIANDEGNWVLDKTVNGVEFYYKIAKCNGKNVVLLKFNNKSGASVKVAWKEVFKTQLEHDKEGVYGEKQMTIPAGETYADDCTGDKNKELLILPEQVNPTYPAEIKQFRYAAIRVTKAV